MPALMRTLLVAPLAVASLLTACGKDGATAPDTLDPVTLAADVSQTELTTTIQGLEALQTRYTMGMGDDHARDYLVDRVTALGLTAELDPFRVVNETANNIIVKHPGTTNPEVIYIYAAHYDSRSTNTMSASLAPGADDNATGVAGVLEAMRVMTTHSFKHTVWFVFTAAEEQGSLGSKHMASWIMEQGLDVRGVIAPDMIGYWPQGESDQMDILGDPSSSFLVEHMADAAMRLGVPHKKWIEHMYCYGDDHTSFQEKGIPAIAPMDCVEAHNVPGTTEDTPHYHATSDTFATLHMGFTTKVAGVIVTTLAELAEPTSR